MNTPSRHRVISRRLFSIEHGDLAYRADFVIYAAVVGVLTTVLSVYGPPARLLSTTAIVIAGIGIWTLLEYLLHRFVLHGIQPFSAWHMAHHERPAALIATPTLVSLALIASLILLPAWMLEGGWNACALALGIVIGFLWHGITHHAVHHWRAEHAWLRERKRWHALHHRPGAGPCNYGVTSALWDRVFGSGSVSARASPGPGTR
jgi:cyclopropane-fatty-acyl-phospholipid synthase